MRDIDGIGKLRHMLQVMAFCLVVATLQYAFNPEGAYGPLVVYSLCIGMITWAIVDLGRHFLPSAKETGWPRGLHAVALVAGGIAGGYLMGNFIADFLCLALGLYSGPPPSRTEHLRYILVTVMAGAVGIFYFWSTGHSSYLERKMGETQRLAKEARLKLLEAQLEPHMLFNTLANLRALIAVDPQRAQQMLDHMIAYLRATLDASRATTHSLEDEFARLRDYLELMQIRMGSRLSYTLDLPPELAAQRVPTLLLQPLVENSIQHGLEPKVEGGRIAVSASRRDGQLVVEVVDTGIGGAVPMPGGAGFGLTQIRDRLATLYGAPGGLELLPNGAQGMRAVVRLPVQA
jgi:two-component sensor histidine kinase